MYEFFGKDTSMKISFYECNETLYSLWLDLCEDDVMHSDQLESFARIYKGIDPCEYEDWEHYEDDLYKEVQSFSFTDWMDLFSFCDGNAYYFKVLYDGVEWFNKGL